MCWTRYLRWAGVGAMLAALGCALPHATRGTDAADVGDARFVDTASDHPDAACPAGQVRCGSACVSLATDHANCGTCAVACASSETCSGGMCHPGCAHVMCGTACVDITTDANNCGSCGHACASGQTCVGGTCRCPGSMSACGATCVDLATDPNNCGSCGHACTASTGGPLCVAGTCTTMCPLPMMICGGACIDTNSNVMNCGGCGNTCSPMNVMNATCSSGACSYDTCAPGFGDCDGDRTNGCETPTTGDTNNCGGCGVRCSTSGAHVSGATCRAGVCGVMCSSGFADCAMSGTACATNVNSTVTSCGSCATSCLGRPNSSGGTCNSGHCTLTCNAGFADCDGNPANGCEASLSSPASCMNCSTMCSAPSTTCCADGCHDTTSENANCGTCGHGCSGSTNTCCASVCTNTQTSLANCGSCGTSCAAGRFMPLCCSGGCVDASNDNNNCGRCGTQCHDGSMCTAGHCVCPSTSDHYCTNDSMCHPNTDTANCFQPGTGGHCGTCTPPSTCNTVVGACT